MTAVLSEENVLTRRLAGIARQAGLAEETSTRWALCDCTDDTHPYDPRGNPDFEWKTTRQAAENLRRFYAAHVVVVEVHTLLTRPRRTP